MNIVTTPEAIITAAVLISALAWAVTASIMAYNRGRSVSTMAERHNSVVKALNEALRKRDRYRSELNAAEDELSNSKADKELFQALYTEASNKLSKYYRPRDPKTGRIVKAPKPTPEKSEGLAALTEMMDNAIEQLNGLKIINDSDPESVKLCDEIKANAVNDIDPRTEAALEMGRTMGNSSRK